MHFLFRRTLLVAAHLIDLKGKWPKQRIKWCNSTSWPSWFPSWWSSDELLTKIWSPFLPTISTHAELSPSHKRAFSLFNREKGARGGNGGGEKGTWTGQKIKSILNLKLTTLNMTRKVWKWRLLLSLRSSSIQSFPRLPILTCSVVIPL